MGTPIVRLDLGERRFPRKRAKRSKELPTTDERKKVNTIFLVIRKMESETSLVETPISAHPTSMDATIRLEKEERDCPFTKGVTFRIVGLTVTKEITLLNSVKGVSPISNKVERGVGNSTNRRTELSLVNNLEGDEDGDQEEEDTEDQED